jgi:hypothetical protein
MSEAVDWNEHRRSMSELIRTAKVLQEKAEHAAEKAEQFYKSFGLTLAELKRRKPDGITWPAFVKKHFSIGRSRADDLIRIGSGSTTVERVREEGRRRAKKVRTADTPLRNGGSPDDGANVRSRRTLPVFSKPDDNIAKFLDRLSDFTMDFVPRVREWHDLNPEIDEEGRRALVHMLSTSSMDLQRLAQMIDGR